MMEIHGNLQYQCTEITMMIGSEFGLRHGGDRHDPLARP